MNILFFFYVPFSYPFVIHSSFLTLGITSVPSSTWNILSAMLKFKFKAMHLFISSLLIHISQPVSVAEPITHVGQICVVTYLEHIFSTSGHASRLCLSYLYIQTGSLAKTLISIIVSSMINRNAFSYFSHMEKYTFMYSLQSKQKHICYGSDTIDIS